MKTSKKTLALLCLLLGLAGLFYFGVTKVLAAPADDLGNATYTKVSDSEIAVKLPNGKTITFQDRSPGDNIHNWKPTAVSGRDAGIVFCVSTRYSPNGGDPQGYDPSKGITFDQNTGSYSIDVDFDNGQGCSPGSTYSKSAATLSGLTVLADGQPCNPAIDANCTNCTSQNGNLVCTSGSANDTTNNAATSGGTCESNSNIGLEWIVCPTLRLIDGIVTNFYGFVEDQLCFPTGPSSTNGGITCQDNKGNAVNNNLTPEVHKTWSIIKNLATVVIVVVMLVMVISQAFGGGPFDAYTIRKLLPKLVAAVILLQLSWILAKWAIDLTNDVGGGIKGLMYAAFPPNVGDIDVALRNVGAGGVTLGAGIFAGLAAAVVFSGLTIGGILIIAITGLAALFVGFLVLFIRKILIIFCVIFLPLAIIAWILPGTERFWKLWRETFTKLLLMFPLIVGLIAAGRIFGYVAGGTSHNITALFAVLLGFFGPLFVLPKTYQWGGSALGSLGGAIINSSKGLRRKPMEYSMSKAGENRQFRGIERARRIGRDPLAASRLDRILAGGTNIALSRGARTRGYAKTVAEGQQAGREAVGQELTVRGYQNWSHAQKLDANEAWLRGEEYAGINAEGNDELRLFAFKTLADLGDQDRIRRARQQGRLKGSVWLKGRAENISSLNQQASDMGIQNNLSEVAPDAMANWKSHTYKEWIRQVQNGVVMDNTDEGGGDIRLTGETREKQLANAQSQAQRVMNNRLVFDRLSLDQQDLVRRMATRDRTQVSVSEAGVELPTGENLAARQSTRENMIENLSAGGSRGQAVARNLASQVVQANLNPGSISPQDHAGLEEVVVNIRDRAAAPDATEQITQALRNVQQAVDTSLKEHEAEAERRLTAANSPNTSALLAAERARTAAVKTRLGI